MSPEDVFRAVTAAGDQSLSDPQRGPMEFYVEDALLQGGVRAYLPSGRDQDLEQYVTRVSGLLGGRRFGLRVEEYSSFDHRTWFRLREFLRPLFDVVGIPEVPSHIVAFLGDYARTPFGVHQDPHETFVFVISGKKMLRTWPAAFFEGKAEIVGALNYDASAGDATTLDGGEGDVLYCPANHWHVAESAHGFSISLSLAVFASPVARTGFRSHLWNQVGERLGALGDARNPVAHPRRLQSGANRISRTVETAARSLRASLDDSSVQHAVKADWLERATSLSIASVPRPLPWRTLNDDDLLCLDPCYPVVWLPGKGHKMICAANGHSFSIAAHPGVRKMLGQLNGGRVSRVQDLIEKYSGRRTVGGVEIEAHPEGVRDILEKLVSLRAVTVTEPALRRGADSRQPPGGPKATAVGSIGFSGKKTGRGKKPDRTVRKGK